MVGLAVHGSPRAGNTAAAAGDLLAGWAGSGDATELVAADAIAPIGDARLPGDYDDGFRALVARVAAADLLVLATPLYWYGPSAQIKAFLDRWSDLLDHEEASFRAAMRGKRTALVVAQGERGFYEAGPCLQMLEWTLRYLDMVVAARVVVVGHAREDYARDTEQRAAVRAVGATLAAHPIAPDLLPPWFHVTRRPGAPLGGILEPASTWSAR